MHILRKIEEVTLFNKVRSSEIRKSLNIEPLLLRIERSQLRWFGHVTRMPQERLPKQALLAKANGRRPVNCRGDASPHRELASPHRDLASPSRFSCPPIEI